MSSKVSIISNLDDQQVHEQAPERDGSDTLKREEKVKLTLLVDVQNQEDLPNDTIQNETLQGDIKDGIPTCREQANGKPHTGDLMAQ